MSQIIKIVANNQEFKATLNESEAAKTVYKALPFEGTVNTWGDEIYFHVSLDISLEQSAQAETEIGDLAYWPMGNAFCIFFGKTPASTGEKPVAAAPVNIIGALSNQSDIEKLKQIREGENIGVRI